MMRIYCPRCKTWTDHTIAEHITADGAKASYTKAVDAHIYGIHGCKTVDDWITLAVAAMDQAGFSVHSQHLIHDELESLSDQEGLQ